jgi:hypothetical protein
MNWGAVEAEPEQRVALDEPHTRQLRGKLRELRFHVEREQAEIDRAWRAMQVCMCEHLREEAQ